MNETLRRLRAQFGYDWQHVIEIGGEVTHELNPDSVCNIDVRDDVIRFTINERGSRAGVRLTLKLVSVRDVVLD